MEKRIALLTDSCCDLPPMLLQQYGITVLPLLINTCKPEPETNQTVDKFNVPGFYHDLQTGLHAFTSAVRPEDFIQAMRPLLAAGTDLLYIGFSSALSATYANCCMAAQQMVQQFPERKIYCVDSKSASMGEGLIVYQVAQKLQAGCALLEAARYAESLVPQLCHWFTVESIKLLKHGGRISANVSASGSKLHMKPLLHVDEQGHLVYVEKMRGRRAVLDAMVEKLKQTAVEITSQTVMISQGDCYADAAYLEQRIREECHPVDIFINTVNPVIAAHSGPKTLALFFVGTKR